MKKIKPQWCKVVKDYKDHKIVLIQERNSKSTEIEDKPGLALTWFLGNWHFDYRVVYKNKQNEWMELDTEHDKNGKHIVKYIPWQGLFMDVLKNGLAEDV